MQWVVHNHFKMLTFHMGRDIPCGMMNLQNDIIHSRFVYSMVFVIKHRKMHVHLNNQYTPR